MATTALVHDDTTADAPGASDTSTAPVAEVQVEADLLVEDVSIDGMCGVY